MPAKGEAIKLVKKLDRKDMIFCLAHVPGTQQVVFGSSDFHVYEVDLGLAKPAARILRGPSHESYVTGLALAGRWAVSGGYDGRLIWWDLIWGERVRAVEAHEKWIRDVCASPDGTTIASVADDMVCRLWDAESGIKRHELRGHESMTPHHYPSMLYACAFSSDGRHLATADKVGHIVVWDVATGEPLSLLDAPVMYTWDPVQRRHSIGGIRALAFSPRGHLLAVGGIGKIGNIDHLEGPARVEVFDWKKNERTHEFTAGMPKGIVERLAFHPEGDRLLAVGGANDGFLLVLDLMSKSVRLQTKAPTHIHDAEFGETFQTIYTAAHGSVGLYEIMSS
jgi:hypothetical protein